MKKTVVIVAGGSGTRAGGDVPKQFQTLFGRPVLWWSMKAFRDESPDCRIIVVMHPGFFDLWDILCDEIPAEDRIGHETVCGGRSRCESVKNGLMAIDSDYTGLVAVHDAARPLVDSALISRGWEAAERHGAAVPAVAVADSLRRLTPQGSESVRRSDFVAVQTPQVFGFPLLWQAYSRDDFSGFTDDASVVEAAGAKITLFDGSPDNFKITNPSDLGFAGVVLSSRRD